MKSARNEPTAAAVAAHPSNNPERNETALIGTGATDSTQPAPAQAAVAWKRWALLPAYLVMLIAVWSNKTELLDWIHSGAVSPALMLLIVTGLACVPIIPFSVVIGTMGYLYGPLPGALISLIGAWLAALLTYGLFRYVLQDRARLLLRRYAVTARWTSLVEHRPFGSVLLARLIPVVPQLAVNAYAAAVSLPFLTYAGASLLGKIPGMLVFAFIGGRIAGDRNALITAAAVYAGFLIAVYAGNRIWKRKGSRQQAE
ncbi:TVP38/TMEM64 family protein [Paenibacillus rhizovicinus]|uniref:TVP38/TMEM64 family membrane protein n=1 Tax=Paenibacillus rhizovicinus TaxID=2704463 RepID=A0A6C0NUT6_9BACL|nr:TVP38/TMEM64 family protein [Paenibacillus rhizovicinus]QHW29960.1 TVP38/TMEM64 family protein [Paenibacillus rhizovicinus]